MRTSSLLPSRASRLSAVLAAGLLTAAATLAGPAPGASAAVPTPPSGYTLTWSDDFTGAAGSAPSSANWIVDTGTSYPGGPANWGTGEVQTYTSSAANLQQDGSGNLKITPIRDSSGNWTSARIETQRTDFQAAAGGKALIQARIQMPSVTGAAASGYWPAFWTLGADYRGNYQNWPGIGEFDVMENVNGANSVWRTLHCGTNPGGPCNETTGLGASRACPSTTCTGNFHTYGFEWDRSTTPEALRWYVDGTLFHTVTADQVDATTWANATHHGHFILLNVAMGGAFPNAIAGSTTPTASTASGYPMLVDYVAVYNAAGSGSGGGSGGTSAYSTIQAESYASQSGTTLETTTDTGGGQDVGYIANGDWLRYNGVDFGSTGATQFKARVASGAASGVSGLVEVRLDSPTATPVGSFSIAGTGGWQTWTTVPANISRVTGTHDVYLTFTSGQSADFVNLNWFTFTT
jgi:hypothetical protein